MGSVILSSSLGVESSDHMPRRLVDIVAHALEQCFYGPNPFSPVDPEEHLVVVDRQDGSEAERGPIADLVCVVTAQPNQSVRDQLHSVSRIRTTGNRPRDGQSDRGIRVTLVSQYCKIRGLVPRRSESVDDL